MNKNHDPKTGQFAEGPGGLAAGLGAEHSRRKKGDYVTLYHHTYPGAAEKIVAGGFAQGRRGHVYLTTKANDPDLVGNDAVGQDRYAAVIEVKVPRGSLTPDSIQPKDGKRWYTAPVDVVNESPRKVLAAGLGGEAIRRRNAQKTTYEYEQLTRPTGESAAFRDKQLAGTLKDHKYPAEVDFPLFHASSVDFKDGDLIEPGHPGNFVRRMKHVYAAEDGRLRDGQYGGNVYEIRPTGPIGHRADARKDQGYWASEWPYQVVRKVPVK